MLKGKERAPQKARSRPDSKSLTEKPYSDKKGPNKTNGKTQAMPSRAQFAETYKQKSDESFLAAQECLKNDLYRATCNRAWYATMQIITAGVYMGLTVPAPKDRPNWTHERQAALFKELITKLKRYQQYAHLVTHINQLLDRRYDADYSAPETASTVTKEDAQDSVAAAESIRKAVLTLVGPIGPIGHA